MNEMKEIKTLIPLTVYLAPSHTMPPASALDQHDLEHLPGAYNENGKGLLGLFDESVGSLTQFYLAALAMDLLRRSNGLVDLHDRLQRGEVIDEMMKDLTPSTVAAMIDTIRRDVALIQRTVTLVGTFEHEGRRSLIAGAPEPEPGPFAAALEALKGLEI